MCQMGVVRHFTFSPLPKWARRLFWPRFLLQRTLYRNALVPSLRQEIVGSIAQFSLGDGK